VERDPSKRRVKPVEPHLLQLDFASSSDDSDFKVLTDDEDADSGYILFRLLFFFPVCMCYCAPLLIGGE